LVDKSEPRLEQGFEGGREPLPNIDEVIARMQADDLEDQIYATPVQYSKIRPVASPQVYGYIRRNRLPTYTCQCGRNVIKIEEADALLRSLGKLPPKLGDEDNEDPEGAYYEDRDDAGREEREQ
jgi:hypothetical protein